MDFIEAATVAVECYQDLASRGVVVEQISEYDRVQEVAEMMGKPYLTPVNSPAWHDFHRSNCIWLVGWADEVPAYFGISRLEDLQGEGLRSYWPRAMRRLYGRGSDVIESVSDTVDSHMTGRLVYFGDLFVNSSCRSASLAGLRAFTALGHLAVSQKWDPDFTYCLVRERDILRGAAANYGFNHVLPSPMRWIDPPSPRSNSEWLAYISRRDLPEMMQATRRALTKAQ